MSECSEGLQGQFVLGLKHIGQQMILAPEVVIERTLRERSDRGNFVHADPAEALSAKQSVRRFEDALASDCRRPGHGRGLQSILNSEFT